MRHIHIYFTKDGGFNESDHPRAENGQFGSGGGGKKKKKSAPTAPDLPGPKSKAAITAIKAAAAKGDWRAVENVNVLGTHPQVAAYRAAMSEHLQSGGKALTEAVGKAKGT